MPEKSLVPPQGVRNKCKRGLELAKEYGGNGLEAATIREARSMANGEAQSENKMRKGYRWWARNKRFLKMDEKSPAGVAALLWGGEPGMHWFERVGEQFLEKSKGEFDMPLKRCDSKSQKGWKWGDQGNCYIGKNAKNLAIKQGLAIEGPDKFDKIMKENGYYISDPERPSQQMSWGGIVIVDIDNTVLKYGDVPITKTIEKVNKLAEDNKIVIVSGRPESDRAKTVKALKSAGIKYNRLILNKIGNSSEDQLESKRNAAESLQSNDDVILAIDDNPKARKVYNEMGIKTSKP